MARSGNRAEFTFVAGAYPDTWLVQHRGQPLGAIGFAEGDGRWRAAWRGDLVGSSYETREDAARALLERRDREGTQS